MISDDHFPTGAVVMIKDPNRSSKMEPTFIGPYTVASRLTSGAYVLRDAQGIILTRTVPASFMKLVQRNPASLSSDDEAQTYEVTHISAHRGPAAYREYLTHWRGFVDPTRVPAGHFDDLKIIQEY